MKKLILAAGILSVMSGYAIADSNEVYMNQVGAHNSFNTTQEGDGNDIATNGNRAIQHGGFNKANLTQKGDNNFVNKAEQYGFGNRMTGLQDGNHNTMSYQQGGFGNTGIARQYGDYNVTVHSQHGYGNSFNALQKN
ncbi:hypothetical protein C8E00_102180 [Chromohalobacter marismortui]|uniref:Curlin associated repeat-containing protein n=1 Tax=Chromohalobacter marismortui TaxID=42055 RepID=A0A4R7NSX7_9GAMM|nr:MULTISPECIES: hypothetical protein [Chromohalobacter]MCI0511293.1 hypothetical protein [Chromohalobacter sp.]MCI0592253.1 hypothetical protein [Chromohalobacter sp.]TDU23691.1 hypothetical protein C8E00_102180 [Chromohalobacter marismortui]